MRRVAETNNVELPPNCTLSETETMNVINCWAVFELFRIRKIAIYMFVCFGFWYDLFTKLLIFRLPFYSRYLFYDDIFGQTLQQLKQ